MDTLGAGNVNECAIPVVGGGLRQARQSTVLRNSWRRRTFLRACTSAARRVVLVVVVVHAREGQRGLVAPCPKASGRPEHATTPCTMPYESVCCGWVGFVGRRPSDMGVEQRRNRRTPSRSLRQGTEVHFSRVDLVQAYPAPLAGALGLQANAWCRRPANCAHWEPTGGGDDPSCC